MEYQLNPPPPPLSAGSVPGGSASGGSMLGRLAGVRPADDAVRMLENREAERIRSRPRVTLRPVHALVVMLLLVGALAASLTLLAQQAANASRTDRAAVAAAAGTVVAENGTGGALPDAEAEPGKRADETDGMPSDSGSESPTPGGGADGAGADDSGHSDDGDGPTSSPSPSSSSSASEQAADDGRVNLNTASAAELDAVKGIGPAIAQRIVDHRNRNGPFSSVDELLDVPGIGPKTLAKMRDQLVAR